MLSDKVLLIAAAAAVANAAYDTYPQVPKTASINGFADPIYSNLPVCAQSCVKEDTGITPCPYWDAGCLCVMSSWGNLVADCIASSCRGSAVVSATSLAQSICSSAGAGSWWLAATEVSLLEAAATATPITSDAISSAQSAATSQAVSSVISAATSEESSLFNPTETSDESSSITSALASDKISAVSSAAVSNENPTITSAISSSTTTAKAHTASINGFADPIYSDLPSCAQPCVKEDTGITPCPYWDTGCLCVMSKWGNKVADCVASSCTGNDVVSMTSLAQSMCSSAGAVKWYLAASESSLLESAASTTATSSPEISDVSSSTISASTTSASSSSAINSDLVTSYRQSSIRNSDTVSSSAIASGSLTSLLPSSAVSTSPTVSAAVGNCKINGIVVDTVDIATGICSFNLPASLPAKFDYVSSSDYVAEFYYAEVNGNKFFTNITEEGLTINIAASLIFSVESTVEVLQVIADSSSQRKRASDAQIQEFVTYLETIVGTPLPCGGIIISVDDDVPTGVTTAGYECSVISDFTKSTGLPSMYPTYNGNTTTVGEKISTITVTSCSDNQCSVTTVLATPTLTTESENGETTEYTTYCPTSETETKNFTTVVTITSCSENKCSETIVPVSPTLTTETKNGKTTVYTTYFTTYETTKKPGNTSPTNIPENTVTIEASRSSSVTSTASDAAVTISVANSGANIMRSCYGFFYTFLALAPFLI